MNIMFKNFIGGTFLIVGASIVMEYSLWGGLLYFPGWVLLFNWNEQGFEKTTRRKRRLEERIDDIEFELSELRLRDKYSARLKDIAELQRGALYIADSLGALTDYLGVEHYKIDKPAIKGVGYRKKSKKK